MFQLCSGGLKVYRGGGAPAHRKWCYFNNEERTLYHVFHWKGTQVGNSSGFFYHLDIQEGTRAFCFKHGVPCTPSESTSATFLFLKVRFRHTNYLLRVRKKRIMFWLEIPGSLATNWKMSWCLVKISGFVTTNMAGKCLQVLLKVSGSVTTEIGANCPKRSLKPEADAGLLLGVTSPGHVKCFVVMLIWFYSGNWTKLRVV